MTVTLNYNAQGEVTLSGYNDDFLMYEKEIINGKRECLFTVEFKNVAGQIVSTEPIPLTMNGEPKISPLERMLDNRRKLNHR